MRTSAVAVLFLFVVVVSLSGVSPASSITFNVATDKVASALNDNGSFLVTDSPGGLFGANGFATPYTVGTYGTNYADAGFVLFFDGGLMLGDLESVSITSSNNSLVYTNLWLDTGNDGKFFQFGGSSGEQLMSLNGDTYLGGPAGGVNSSSIFDIYAGVGSGSYTLAQLQSGAVAGIDANTRAALWVGIAGNTAQSVNIPSITVTTVPEPSSLVGMGTGLLALGGIVRRRIWR